jgi:hypothetical protein
MGVVIEVIGMMFPPTIKTIAFHQKKSYINGMRYR